MTDARRVEFFFDVGSPYSYLAATQIDAVAAKHGAAVSWRPFLLGGVFKATGNDMPARVLAKARWMLGDLSRWAARYGVPFRMSSRFPLNTLRTQRALVGVELASGGASVMPFARALYRAYWVEDRDVSTDEVIADAAREVGLDPAAVVAAIDAPATKERLRSSTDEAVARGAFGAPTMFVGDVMFWGNDRLDLLEAELG